MQVLKTDSDRLNYGNILMPPVGYHLEKAVGSSYSLDLEALTAVAITLGLLEATDTELKNNPICLLNALEKVSHRILLFCESGQIKVPKNPSALCILLEKMVYPVSLPKKAKMNRYPAFHPKTWVLQYINESGHRKYRFIVLSRNLTFDRSWDVSVVLDSSDTVTQPEKTQPIISFLQFLNSQIKNDTMQSKEKKSLIRVLCKDLSKVSFDTECKEFHDFMILPLGIGKEQYDMNKDLLFCDTFHELVIMSPFLSGSVIEALNKDTKGLTECKRTLITRKSELSKLKPSQVSNFRVFALKDTIIDGEDSFSDENMEEKQKQDIHAKIYLRRKYSDTDFYLGSMNASYAAMNQNVEMMVYLSAKNRYLNGTMLLNDIFCGEADAPENPFEEVQITGEEQKKEEDEKNNMEQMIKKICRMNGSASITKNEDNYDVTIKFDTEENWNDITIAPLRSKKQANFASEVVIKALDMLQLSEFYTVRVEGTTESIERVIMIPTVGLPMDRESAVVNSIVNDKKSFIEYIAFVLGDDYLLSFLEKKKLGESGIFSSNEDAVPAVYEKMLKTSLNEPERLGEITYLMNMITDDNIIPDEFREMYEIFRKTVKLK